MDKIIDVIIKNRQKGKTYELIQKIKDNPQAILITFCQREKNRLQILEPLIKDRIFSIHEFETNKSIGMKGFTEAYIDNIDIVLQKYSVPVKCITLTSDGDPNE